VIGAAFKDRKMAVRAKAGSMLPENRQFLENKILQLAQMGALTDQEYILEHMELPGKERLLRKLAEQKEAMAMQEQQQQGMADMGNNPEEIFQQLQANPELAQQMQGQLGVEENRN
jgi:hypothetical protein